MPWYRALLSVIWKAVITYIQKGFVKGAEKGINK